MLSFDASGMHIVDLKEEMNVHRSSLCCEGETQFGDGHSAMVARMLSTSPWVCHRSQRSAVG